MQADKYYGIAARNYDSARCHSLRWANEQRAVSDMVFSGPLLDCPLGTGRYVSIYREKGIDVVGVDISSDMLAVAKARYPDLDARTGSILALPFEDRSFETAVSIRLFDWLYPEQMAKAVRELRRVARTLIVSIRYGEEGEGRVNYTHDLAKFFAECQGLTVCDHRVTEITADGVEEIFRLRPPEWSDLTRQFWWHGHTPEFEAYRLAAEWTERFGFNAPIISEDSCRLLAEFWSGEDLGVVLDRMTEHHPAYTTDQAPKRDDWPATILRHQGHCVILDGRRRANRWRKTPGLYPVLVIEPCPPASS